jgi:GDPmannose 4,6-dehydratase
LSTRRSNETHSVREFIERSFEVVGIRIRWVEEGLDEVGKCDETGMVLVRVYPKYFRWVLHALFLLTRIVNPSLCRDPRSPAEVDLLHGDSTKAEHLLGWRRKVTFEKLVREMVLADVGSV